MDATDSLFGPEPDDRAVRIELRLKYNAGPFDSDGYSIEVMVGGKLVALELVPLPQSGQPNDFRDVMAPALERLYKVVLGHGLTSYRLARNLHRLEQLEGPVS